LFEKEIIKVLQSNTRVFETRRLIVRTASKEDVDLYYEL
jgi:hypothetical protein